MTFSSGEVLTAANLNDLEITSATLTTTATTDTELLRLEGAWSTTNRMAWISGVTTTDDGVLARIGLGTDPNGANNNDGGIVFQTTSAADTTGSTLATAMTIADGGQVGIGNTNPAYPLDVKSSGANTAAKIGNSDTSVTSANVLMRLAFVSDANCTNGYFMTFQDSAASIGSVQCASTSTVVFNTTSDYRLKENVNDLTGALATVNALRPVTFNFTRDEEGIEHKGFLAHEVAEVAPRAVTGEKDAVDDDGEIAPQMIDPSKLVAMTVGAIQEQQTQIDALTARIEALETGASP